VYLQIYKGVLVRIDAKKIYTKSFTIEYSAGKMFGS
jgi:hypothetical protein